MNDINNNNNNTNNNNNNTSTKTTNSKPIKSKTKLPVSHNNSITNKESNKSNITRKNTTRNASNNVNNNNNANSNNLSNFISPSDAHVISILEQENFRLRKEINDIKEKEEFLSASIPHYRMAILKVFNNDILIFVFHLIKLLFFSSKLT